MNKKYQVFVSSTYEDLKDERLLVLDVLLKLRCIPAGMELFPAADDSQWEFITKTIDESDYYVLIIGGRYGSLHESGVSYTEMEFDYALAKGKRILAFLHDSPHKLPRDKTDSDLTLMDKLDAFRGKAKTKRIVDFWNNSDDLGLKVTAAIANTQIMYPSNGWVRHSNLIEPEGLLIEVNNLMKENLSLKKEIQELKDISIFDTEELADYESEITVYYSGYNYKLRHSNICKKTMSWNEIIATLLAIIAPSSFESSLSENFAAELFGDQKPYHTDFCLENSSLFTIRYQLLALGLITFSDCREWTLTDKGERKLLDLRVIRK